MISVIPVVLPFIPLSVYFTMLSELLNCPGLLQICPPIRLDTDMIRTCVLMIFIIQGERESEERSHLYDETLD